MCWWSLFWWVATTTIERYVSMAVVTHTCADGMEYPMLVNTRPVAIYEPLKYFKAKKIVAPLAGATVVGPLGEAKGEHKGTNKKAKIGQ